MLTADLVKVRRSGDRLQPQWLKGRAIETWKPLADAFVEVFEQSEGMAVAEVDRALAALVDDTWDRVRVAGFLKLLKDRCEIEEPSGSEAEAARSRVFQEAARVRRGQSLREVFDRESVLASCARELECTSDQLEAKLFSDLPGAQSLRGFKRLSSVALLQRYNLALAQGVLLRATRVEVRLAPASGARFREIFRAIKFCRLLYQVSGTATSGYELVVDGPLSLFESTQRYGLQLALLLPTLVAGEGWSLVAEVLWGKERRKMRFELSWRDGLVSSREAAGELEEVAQLERNFARTEGEWVVRREAEVFDIRGRGVFVPDLVFEHKTTGQRVYFEVFGFWSREAVFKRLELLDSSFPHKVILGVAKKLRVSEQAAEEGFPGRIVVYTQSLSAHSVRRALQEMLEPQ